MKITQQWSLDRRVPESHYNTSYRNDEAIRHYTKVQYSTIQYNDESLEHLAPGDTALSTL